MKKFKFNAIKNWYLDIDCHVDGSIGISGEGWNVFATVVNKFNNEDKWTEKGKVHARLVVKALEMAELLNDIYEYYPYLSFKDRIVKVLSYIENGNEKEMLLEQFKKLSPKEREEKLVEYLIKKDDKDFYNYLREILE